MSFPKTRWLVVIVIGLVLLYPFKKTLVPAKQVLVTTKDMHPIKAALVRQIWQDYSLESSGHEEDLRTDASGRVTFPARSIRAPLILRLLGPVRSVLGQGVHASFGVHTDMFLANNEGQVMSEVAQGQPHEIWFRLEPES